MAENFIGKAAIVHLKDPSGWQYRGTIHNVNLKTAQIVLSNVNNVKTGEWYYQMVVSSQNIQDIELSTHGPPLRPHPPPEPVQPASSAQQSKKITPDANSAAPTPTAPSAPGTFIDPAIVSIGKPPRASVPGSTCPPLTAARDRRDSHLQNLSTAETEVSPARHTSQPSQPPPTILARRPAPQSKHTHQHPVLAIRTEHTPGCATGRAPSLEKADSQANVDTPKKKRGALSKNSQQLQTGDNGWRQTPILQATPSFQPFDSLKKKNAKGRQAADNGWMSEDVKTSALKEFDFEGNLAKFPKDSVFDQYRKEDQVKDADRLVSHNRLTKPGTAGGKNFHSSEMVLDKQPAATRSKTLAVPPGNDFWNSEAENGGILNGDDKRQHSREPGSGRSSRRGESKVSTARRSQSRKASSQAPAGHPMARVNSGLSIATARPKLLRRETHSREAMQEQSESSQGRRRKLLASAPVEGFYLVDTNKHIETVSPLQMLNLENIAHNEVGLTEEMMTENSGRGIAEVTLMALDDPAVQLRSSDMSASPPTVVIMAGNNKSGIRAVASGRHLRNKGINILLCVVGIERERDLLEDLSQQVRIFRNMGGRVFSKPDLFEHLRKTTTQSTGSSPANEITLIIDALLGLAVSFEELRTSDQAAMYELIQWANRNDAFVLAVDVPTGIDPSTGRVNSIEGDKLYVKPRYVAALAAPKKGILATLGDDGDAAADLIRGADDWKFFLVDLGFGSTVWRKAGAKMRRGIDFEGKWVQEIKIRTDAAADEEDEQ